ncbi:MAG: hypothetical protein PUA88_07695 [Bacillales bacterium]|nr:hypothetical protein [Bacillales bacterium]
MEEKLNKPKNGLASYTFSNGKYVGDWINGLRDGNGTFTFTNHPQFIKYKGEWKDDAPNGKGTLYFKDGTKYEGNFYRWHMSGYGEKNYVDGHVYRGLWYNSKYDDEHGELFQDGKIEYIGSFKEGQFDGKGKLFYKNGEIYEGYFSKGSRHGKGKLTFIKGESIECNFTEGNLDGEGTFINKKGDKYKGTFSGPITSGEGKGYVLYEDGTKLLCNLKKWKLNGIAQLISPDGTIKFLEYRDDKKVHDMDEEETRIGQLFEFEPDNNLFYISKILGHQKDVVFPNEFLGRVIKRISLVSVEYPEEIESITFSDNNEVFEEKEAGIFESMRNLSSFTFGKNLYDLDIKKFGKMQIKDIQIPNPGFYVKDGDGVYNTQDGCLYWIKYRGKNIPKGTTVLGSKSLKHACRNLFMPKSVNVIYFDAFQENINQVIFYEGNKSEFRKIMVIGPNGEKISGFFQSAIKSIIKFRSEETKHNKISVKYKSQPFVDVCEK